MNRNTPIAIGIAVGTSAGAATGSMMGDIGIGAGVGLALGLAIGSAWKQWGSRPLDAAASQPDAPGQDHDIAALREIGWREWDPIGIREMNDDAWQNGAADEYDSYLIEVADGLLSGWSADQAIDYLVSIERDHMALGEHPTARERAATTVDAIAAHIGASRG